MSGPQDLILVVDDDRDVCDSLKFALELEGHAVEACGSGEELMRHPALDRARCLILDYRMPVMNGFEVMERLAGLGRDMPPVIMITGHVTERIRRRAAVAGVRRLLEKPLLDSTLSDAIRCALANGPTSS